mgnify:CR=1 FL=1
MRPAILPRRTLVAVLLVAVAGCGGAGSPGGPDALPGVPGPPSSSSSPVLAGCAVFPADSPWNREVSGDPVDPLSDTYVESIGASGFLHPDFG